jgi:Raf kinase inhibitor-like YbhB/YbcL family protein
MPNPGSHRYDIKRTRLRGRYDHHGVPDQHADRAAGPSGTRGSSRGDPDFDDPPRALSGEVELRSAAFSEHTLIPDRYSYEGGNVSPPLEWRGIPDDTQEVVLLCEDPDAPRGIFTHWVVTNISPRSTGVAQGALPDGGKAGRNGFGELGWGGPRPPVGDEPHRYFFRLYASDQPLGLGEGATPEEVHVALEDHTLARGTLVGLFGR